jgi:hypothetical protein
MNAHDAWEPLDLKDPEPEQVLARFEAAEPGLGEPRTFLLPADFDFYGVENRELIADFNFWMLARFRELTPPGGFVHVLDPDLNHIGYRLRPHAPLGQGATLEQWWGFVPYLQGAVWTVPLLPDGDSYDFVSPAFDWAFRSRYSTSGLSELAYLGAPLLRALEIHALPELLRRLPGP